MQEKCSKSYPRCISLLVSQQLLPLCCQHIFCRKILPRNGAGNKFYSINVAFINNTSLLFIFMEQYRKCSPLHPNHPSIALGCSGMFQLGCLGWICWVRWDSGEKKDYIPSVPILPFPRSYSSIALQMLLHFNSTHTLGVTQCIFIVTRKVADTPDTKGGSSGRSFFSS